MASADVRQLDEALLGTYSARLTALGVPLDGWESPGLTDAEIDASLAPLGLSLPEEARVLWRWHNGLPLSVQTNLLGGHGKWLLSIEEAVELAERHRRMHDDNLCDLATDSDPRYDYAWLAFFGPQHPLMIDCSVPRNAPTPLRMLAWEEPAPPPIRVASLGDAVLLWMEALESGAWEWDRDAQEWQRFPERLPGREGTQLI